MAGACACGWCLGVTVRVTSLRGAGGGLAEYYCGRKRGLGGVSGYYAGEESVGHWFGEGAGVLGLEGAVDERAFSRLLDGRHPGVNGQLGTKFGQKSIRGFDMTFSAPKDVSLLWAFGNEQARAEVQAAFAAARDAIISQVETRAWSRRSVNGAVVPVECRVAMAVFDEYTSRSLDPQLHSHVIISNKTLCEDGRWRAMDGRELKGEQQAWSALFHRALEAELTARLGVEFVSDGWVASRIVGIPDALIDEFSQRSQTVDTNILALTAKFEVEHDRGPTHREAWQLAQTARLMDRPGKTGDTITTVDAHTGWRDQADATGFDPDQIVDAAVGRVIEPVTTVDRNPLVDTAVQQVSEGRSHWTVGGLVRELARALPAGVGRTAEQVVQGIWRIGSETVKEQVQLRTEVDTKTPEALLRFTTQPVLDSEHVILDFATAAAAAGAGTPTVVVGDAIEGLGVAQQSVADRVAGTEPLVLVEGPAGTGKTTALKAATDHLAANNRAVFGVAPSAQAAAELAAATGIACDSIDKLLYEHNRPDRSPAAGYLLEADATVIVDEAAMCSTPKLADLVGLAKEHAWRLVLVGDPYQLSAVGRSGMFEHLLNTAPDLATSLTTVHRFTHDWEATNSLALRAGDPDAITVLDANRRITTTTSSPVGQAVRDWAGHREQGDDVLLMATNTGLVDELNNAAQATLIKQGVLDPAPGGIRLRAGAGLVGDTVVTRRNDRDLGVKNREAWTITGINPATGNTTVANRNGVTTLPANYCADHLELGYAQTVHGAQGRTIDTGLFVITPDTAVTANHLYVATTRGRHHNHIIIQPTPPNGPEAEGQQTLDTLHATVIEQLAETLSNRWDDTPAITQQTPVNYGTPQPQAAPPSVSAHAAPEPAPEPPAEPDPAVLAGSQLRGLMVEQARLERAMHRARTVIDEIDATTLDHRRTVHTTRQTLNAVTAEHAALTQQLDDHHSARRRDPARLTRAQRRTMNARLAELDTQALPQARVQHTRALNTAAEWDRTLANRPIRHATQQELDSHNTRHTQIASRLSADRDARSRHLLNGTPHPNLGTRATPPPVIDTNVWAQATAAIDQHNTAWPTPPSATAAPEVQYAHRMSKQHTRAQQHQLDQTLKRDIPGREPPGLTR